MFFLEQFEGKYRIYYDGKFIIKKYGSYNVLGARILGLSYGDYLRFLVQNGATIVGKKSKYVSFFFEKKEDAIKIQKLLNSYLVWVLLLGYHRKDVSFDTGYPIETPSPRHDYP